MIVAGIDAGSRTLKMVLWNDQDQQVVAQGLVDQGLDQAKRLDCLEKELLLQAGLQGRDIQARVATGYGRNRIAGDPLTITEITCHARGVRHLQPATRTLIDIGGEDSKLMRLDTQGRVQDFVMNDRCAAGTGRFLEVVARRLEVPLTELGDLAAASTQPAQISSMCVVFAETEIIGLLAAGATRQDIIAGVQLSITERVASMAGGRSTDPVVFTGGGALVSGMKAALEQALKSPVEICPDPQMTGALGAALLAAERG